MITTVAVTMTALSLLLVLPARKPTVRADICPLALSVSISKTSRRTRSSFQCELCYLLLAVNLQCAVLAGR
jgi:hypothetical protein